MTTVHPPIPTFPFMLALWVHQAGKELNSIKKSGQLVLTAFFVLFFSLLLTKSEKKIIINTQKLTLGKFYVG
ncbi:MAG: hypothetical protein U9Q61_04890 [Thermodesulfobacteriota bacterium]|nr:hypothetical protein [Thermodesulfobacteriota bacterium]